MHNKNINSPFHDPLYQLGRNALRQVNVAVLSHLFLKLEKKVAAKTASTYMEAEFRILTAEIARNLGNEIFAVSMLQPVIDNPPAVGVDLLSRAQRVRASIHLDAGEIDAAKNLTEIIDAVVIENSEARGEAMISRQESSISADTYLLMAEVSLYSKDAAAAGEAVIKAGARLAEMERIAPNVRLSAFDSQQKTIYCAELRYKIHLWQAVLRIMSGDAQGFTLLRDLADDLSADAKTDKRLLARVRALLGDFDIEKDAPVGICRKEAVRLFALCASKIGNSLEFVDDDNLLELDVFPDSQDGSPVRLQTEMAVSLSSQGPATLSHVPVGDPAAPVVLDKFLESQTHQNQQLTKMFEQMTELMIKLPVQSAEQNVEKQSKRPFAFGGGFAFFDLVTQLGNAEMSKFTGYFQVQWSPEMVETSILAGNLDPQARAGEGFIFVNEGIIIDATIKNYDPPEEFQAGTDGAEADAKLSLTILIQVGVAQKLDCLPDGFGSGYPSMAVKGRKSRLRTNQFGLAVLIQERDEQLQ